MGVRCDIERSQVIWRFASCRVAAMPVSRNLSKGPLSSAAQAWR